MIEQNFRLNDLRRLTLLVIVLKDTTFIYGTDFFARVLKYQIFDKTYLSKSFYQNNLREIETGEKFRGLILEIPEKESDFAKILLTKRVKNTHNIQVKTELNRIHQSVCRQCKGKGFADWIEDVVEIDWHTSCSPSDLQLTNSLMKKTYIKFNYHNDVTIFYRNRNLQHEYMQECQICPNCDGVGFDGSMLEHFIPYPIIEHMMHSVKQVLDFGLMSAVQLFEDDDS
jgi:hypothetical protein